MPSYHVMASEV